MKNTDISNVYIAADHRGVGLKLYLYEMLMAAGYSVVNLGTDDLNTPVDFPDIANKLADKMLNDTWMDAKAKTAERFSRFLQN